ncbi:MULTISPECIES: hypothetical protein [Sphingobacterium]|uniref:hypothetical protein n=1 Tax=Sphingobacterium TaxID=28453 RepID=UPI001048A4FB|nr:MULTISPECIES: hypothetical protein [Sphingobacterium]MCW2259878.1 hypothetical protein [Sphingobacterium kitahiroshimense]TCR11325.1 hypothetical protein EDF67_104423 [Sphingobacterium sp. JUb78]
MKKLLLLFTIAHFLTSCNGHETKKMDNKIEKIATAKKDTIKINEIHLNSGLDKTLIPFGLNKDDNNNSAYNLNLDYEEFSFSPQQNFKFNDLNIGKIKSLIIYYLKEDNSAFTYELELEDNSNCELLIGEFNKNFGKHLFYQKNENTKEHPIFLDENGEQETRHIIEELIKWDDSQHDISYFVSYKKNLTTNENKLTTIAISNAHKKYAEWIDFRSLSMVFPK